MMFFIPFQTLVARFFDKRRGIALGILGTGFSMGGLFIVPVVAVVIDRFGWDGSFLVSAVVVLAIYVPLGIFVVRDSPSEVGQWPDGEQRSEAQGAPPEVGGLTYAEAIRTPNFWILAFAVTLFFYGMFGWMVHQVPFYESVGISTATASLIVAASAGFGIVTRLVFGLVADRVPSIEMAAMVLAAVLCSAMVTLSITTGPVGIGLFLMFWVIGAGVGPMMEALLLTRAFGARHFATIFGFFIVVETIGQMSSPVLAGYLFDRTGSYDWVLRMWIGTYAASVGLFLLASRLSRPYHHAASEPTESTSVVTSDHPDHSGPIGNL